MDAERNLQIRSTKTSVDPLRCKVHPSFSNMVFLSICTALYDYVPQSENELAIHEGELIYVLEKSIEDDWWRAKKRAPGEEEEEPVGLIPNNYVEEVSTT